MIGERHESMKSRVFVTQEQEKLNYAPAEEFGSVVFITRNEFSPMKASLRNEALVDEIAFKLKTFDAETDYVTVSGSPVVAAVVFLVLGHRGVKTIKMLRWSNRDCMYQPITVQLNQKHI
jgi:hypothetical protein